MESKNLITAREARDLVLATEEIIRKEEEYIYHSNHIREQIRIQAISGHYYLNVESTVKYRDLMAEDLRRDGFTAHSNSGTNYSPKISISW